MDEMKLARPQGSVYLVSNFFCSSGPFSPPDLTFFFYSYVFFPLDHCFFLAGLLSILFFFLA